MIKYLRKSKLIIMYILICISLSAFNCSNSKNSDDIEPAKAYELIQTNNNGQNDIVILDVRTPEEFKSGYIEKALNIDFKGSNFKEEVSNLDKNKTYIVYCKRGHRSGKAVELMKSLGFKKAYNVAGGTDLWSELKLPLTN